MPQESSSCGPGRLRINRPPDKRSRGQTVPFGTSSEIGFSVNNETAPGSATMRESGFPSTTRSCAYRPPSSLPSMQFSIFHRFHENILERVAPEIKTADANVALRRQAIDVANLNSIRKNHLHVVRRDRAFAAQSLDRFGEVAICPVSFQLQKSFVRAPLFFQVRVVSDSSLLQDQHLIARVFHISQQVRAQ